jgi:glutaredoxin
LSTNCVFPPELEDKQLMAYLDDADGNPETARHLAGCPYCKERADALDRFQKHLTTRLYRSTCPSSLELGEFHVRMLPAPQRLVIASHLRECPHCQQEVTLLDGFMREPAPQTSILEAVKVLMARLVSGGALPGTALRGEAKTSPVFEADGTVISLNVQPGPNDEISILGQMAADDQDRWTGASVELKQPYLAALHTTIDDLGAFTFDSVDPGSVQITITSPDGMVIQTEDISIST